MHIYLWRGAAEVKGLHRVVSVRRRQTQRAEVRKSNTPVFMHGGAASTAPTKGQLAKGSKNNQNKGSAQLLMTTAEKVCPECPIRVLKDEARLRFYLGVATTNSCTSARETFDFGLKNSFK